MSAPYATRPRTASVDRVTALLRTQAIDGSFPRSPTLDAWLGRARTARLERASTTHDARRLSTCVALGLLALEAPARERAWRAAADRAHAWCERQPAFADATYSVLYRV